MSLFDDLSNIACPLCGATNPIEIVYGLPSSEMMLASEEGWIALGGCIIDSDAPAYVCRSESCGHRFGKL